VEINAVAVPRDRCARKSALCRIEIVYVPLNDNAIHWQNWLEKEGMRTKSF
jgi:hypothetical protein